MRINLSILFFLLTGFVFSQDIDYKYLGSPYYPEQKLAESDSLKWPINFSIAIDLKDIKELSHKSSTFIANFIQSSYSKYPLYFVSKLKDTINLNHQEWFQLYSRENNPDNKYIGGIRSYDRDEHPYLFTDNLYSKQVQLIESAFDVNWNLRDFPFDKQKLLIKYVSTVDTSIIKLNSLSEFNKLPNTKIPNLQDGFTINSITISSSYNKDESDIIQVSPDEYRPIVTQSLNFEINIDRRGSSLFLKLFIGGIISYLVSSLIFLIDRKELETRVVLGVGAIFGGIGNRYFIDTVLPEVQVLTKADAVSNFILFMIFFNIVIMVLQHTKREEIKYFESSKNSFFYSIYSFIIILIGILLW